MLKDIDYENNLLPITPFVNNSMLMCYHIDLSIQ